MSLRRSALGLALAIPLTCCFYDSRYAEMTRAQESVAQHAAPSALTATPETELPAGTTMRLRVMKLRARATARYVSEVVDWQKQLSDTIQRANAILGPTLSIRIELASTERWHPAASDDDLRACMDNLVDADPGDGVDWVLGLAGSLPRAEMSFHELGIGREGKHLAMRAMNDAREYEAIEALEKVDERARAELYRQRKLHKTTVVFLHELGHTLGAMHEVDSHTVMHPSYDKSASGFSDAAAGLMRLSLEHRLDKGQTVDAAFAKALSGYVTHTRDAWVPVERQALLERLDRQAAPKAAAQPAKTAVAEPESLALLGAADRATFKEAQDLREKGDVHGAWRKAAPLFKAHPTVYAVQDFRCDLAMRIGGPMAAINAECAPLLALTPGVP